MRRDQHGPDAPRMVRDPPCGGGPDWERHGLAVRQTRTVPLASKPEKWDDEEIGKRGGIMKFWIGLLTGFAAGITVGVLFAPARGSVTRRRIAQSAGDLADTSREKIHDVSRMAKRKARQISQMANEKVGLASDFAREKAVDISHAVNAVTEKLQRATA